MKRLSDDGNGDNESIPKKHRCLTHRIDDANTAMNFLSLYFDALTPYERLRFLYVWQGLHSHDIAPNIGYRIALALAHLTLLACGDHAAMRRRYDCKEAPALCAALATRYRTQCLLQVVQQATALQRECGVPRARLIVVAARVTDANDTDDALPPLTIVRYDDGGVVDLLIAETCNQTTLLLPPLTRYTCVDAKRLVSGWSRAQLRQRYEELGLIKTRMWRTVNRILDVFTQLCDDIGDVCTHSC